jgi:outer membrane protein assembly factor BamB
VIRVKALRYFASASLLLLVLLVASAAPTAAAEPATTQAAPAQAWAFHGGGPLLGQAPDLGPPPMKLRWTYRGDEEGDAAIEGAATIARGTVYVADAKGLVHAIDLASGERRWTYPGPIDGFATTPLICGDRVIVGDLAGTVHAVATRDGSKLWTVDTRSPIRASGNAAAADAMNVVIANDSGKVLCLSAAKGDVVWTAQAADRINGAPAISGDTVYVGSCDAKLMALGLADGAVRFTADMGALSGGSAAVLADRLVIGTDEGRVVCLSTTENGKRLWTYEQIAGGAMAYASPAVADGVVVIGARDRQVHAMDLASGTPRWTFKARLDVDSSPLIAGGRVYVGSKDKSLYVLNLADGKMLWEFKGGRGIVASPAIAEGVLVVSDLAGNVYCLEPERK